MRLETADDLTRERAVASIAEEAWGCELLKLGDWGIEFVAVRDRRYAQAWVEVKTYPSYTIQQMQRQPQFFISKVNKIDRMKILNHTTALPCIIMIAPRESPIMFMRLPDARTGKWEDGERSSEGLKDERRPPPKLEVLSTFDWPRFKVLHAKN